MPEVEPGRVLGQARFDGARALLEARGLALPFGNVDDPPGCASVWAVAARKSAGLAAGPARGAASPGATVTVPAGGERWFRLP